MPFTPSDILLFAVDPGTIITLVIILISFIGWIVNLVNEKAKQQQARPRVEAAERQAGGDDRFQDEIDRFLQQVGGRPAPARPVPADDVMIEVVPEDEILQRRREERRGQKLSQIEDRHIPTSHFGEFEPRPQESMDDRVRFDVGDRIAAVVEADFGESKTNLVAPVVGPGGVRPGEIVRLLHDRQGVRNAIIINEILTRRPRRR